MRKEKVIVQKIIASLLVLIIVLTHNAIIGITAITYAVDSITTNSDNVQLKAYFVNNSEETSQIQKSIDDENLNLNIDVNVKNEGYFDGKISLVNSGFKIKEKFDSEYIEKIENDSIYLKQINTNETAKIQVGIKAIDEKEIPVQSLNTNTKVILEGTYYSSKKEVQITGESQVNINWSMPENTKAMLAGKVITNSICKVGEEKKRVVQYLILSKVTNNSYPVKNTEITATVPEGFQNVEVHKRRTNATNGDKDFSTNNYKVENNVLKINVSNAESNGKISWQKNTYDTYVVTYEYNEKADLSTKNISINSNITMCDANQTVLKAEQQQLDLKEEKNGIVTLDNEEIEPEIYKGKIYSGEKREFTTNANVYVDYAKGLNQIHISLVEPIYTKGKNKIQSNTQYKEIRINKANINAILGDTWEIKIKDDSEEENKITNKTEVDEKGNIVIKFAEDVKNVYLLTSEVKNNGTLLMEITKEIIQESDYKKEEVQQLTGIQNYTKIQYSDYEGKKYGKNIVSSIKLKDTETEVSLEAEQQVLNSSNGKQDLTLITVLKTDSEAKDLYKNPKMRIAIPKQVNVVDAKAKLLYANGLEIDEEDVQVKKKDGQSFIMITLTGEQEVYQSAAIEGTKIVVNAQVEVANQNEDTTEEIILNYKNEKATRYKDNGVQKIGIKILATREEEDNKQTNTKQQEIVTDKGNNQNKDFSNQELQIDFKANVGEKEIKDGGTVKAGEIIAYNIAITNTSNKLVEHVNINAIVPENTNLIEVNPKYPDYNEAIEEYTDKEEYYNERLDRNINKENISIEAGKTYNYTFMVKAKADAIGNHIAETKISIKKDNVELKEIKQSNQIDQGSFELTCKPLYRVPGKKVKAGLSNLYKINVKNLTDVEQKNIEITLNKNDIVNINEVSWVVSDGNSAEFDGEQTKFVIDSIPAKSEAEVVINATFKIANKSVNDKIATMSVTAKDSKGIEHKSNKLEEEVEGINMQASISTESHNEYLVIGDQIKYIIKIINTGDTDANKIEVQDQLSEYLDLKEVKVNGKDHSYTEDNVEVENIKYNMIIINSKLKAGDEAIIEILGKVKDNVQNNLEVLNKATIYNEGAIVAETEQVKKIIKNEENDKSQITSKANASTISGIAWLDENKDGIKNSKEQLLSGVTVYAIDVDKNEFITNSTGEKISTTTKEDGTYSLQSIPFGNYIVVFEYDTQIYKLTKYESDYTGEENNSNVIKSIRKVDDKELIYAYTDIIDLNENGSRNINMGLIKKEVFDLELEKVITKATIINSTGTKDKEFKETNLAKLEIKSKDLKDTNVNIEYKIKIKNTGDIAGYAKNIVDYLPPSLTFNSELNKDWYKEKDNIYNKSLADIKIQPGETKELTLILTKSMNELNIGLTHNNAEIVESYNYLEIKDKDSITGNKKIDEDDIASADIIISTGTMVRYICLAILIIIIIGGISCLVIGKKLKDTRNIRKEV